MKCHKLMGEDASRATCCFSFQLYDGRSSSSRIPNLIIVLFSKFFVFGRFFLPPLKRRGTPSEDEVESASLATIKCNEWRASFGTAAASFQRARRRRQHRDDDGRHHAREEQLQLLPHENLTRQRPRTGFRLAEDGTTYKSSNS